MQSIVRWFSHNSILANCCVVVIFIMGGYAWIQVKKEVFPEITFDQFNITVSFPNASAEEVAEGIIDPIENAIQNIEGIDKISSTAFENTAQISVKIKTSSDIDEVLQEVKDTITGLTVLPEDAEKATYKKVKIRKKALSVLLYSEHHKNNLRQQAIDLKEQILQYRYQPQTLLEKISALIRGKTKISSIDLVGSNDEEITITVQPHLLRQYRLSFNEVVNITRESLQNIAVGKLKSTSSNMLLQLRGKSKELAKIKTTIIKQTQQGNKIYLQDIATISRQQIDQKIAINYSGKSGILLQIYRSGNDDVLAISDAVHAFFKKNKALLAQRGMAYDIWFDDSKILRDRLYLVWKNGLIGLLLVLCILGLFMRPSIAFFVALGIPLSFICGLYYIYAIDSSINIISGFAFILVLGIVVDDAIVVSEGIFSAIERGIPPKKASWVGTVEVGKVVTFGVLTTVLTFTPMLGLSGNSGKIWPHIPYAVIPVLLSSLILSKTILPAQLSGLSFHHKQNLLSRLQQKTVAVLVWFAQSCYQPFIRFLIPWRYIVFSGFLALLIIAIAAVKYGWVPFTSFPKVEGNLTIVKVEMRSDAHFQDTQVAIQALQKTVWQVAKKWQGEQPLEQVITAVGTSLFGQPFAANSRQSENKGELLLKFTPANSRQVSMSEFMNACKKEFPLLPKIYNITYENNSGSNSSDIEITVQANNTQTIYRAIPEIIQQLRQIAGVQEVWSNKKLGNNELYFSELTPLAKKLGFTLSHVARNLQKKIDGVKIQTWFENKTEIPVRIIYPKSQRSDQDSIAEISLLAPNGQYIALKNLVVLKNKRSPEAIYHTDNRVTYRIYANVNKESANVTNIVRRFKVKLLPLLQKKYPQLYVSFEGEEKDRMTSIKEMAIRFIFVLCIIYMLLAIALSSYIKPVIIMMVIPFSLTAVIYVHMLFDINLSIISICGLIALAGVVINDSLVLVDSIHQKSNTIKSLQLAVITSATHRFRPIFLTSLTTFLGLAPMLYETDLQAKFIVPMALSLGYGILFSTLITLILVPLSYIILADIYAIKNYIFKKNKINSPVK